MKSGLKRLVVLGHLEAAIFIFSCAGSFAQISQSDICTGKTATSPAARIGACTSLLDAGTLSQKGRALAFYYRGRAHKEAKNFKSAVEDYGRAIALEPTFSDAFFYRALAVSDSDYKDASIEAAEKDYTAAIRVDPANAAAYLNRGSIYLHAGQTARAIQDYSQAIKLDAAAALPLLGRAIAHYNGRAYPAAISDFTAALKLDPKNAVALYGRGLSKNKTGSGAGDSDISTAKSLETDISKTFKEYGGK